MDADRRNNFNNNKSVGGVVVSQSTIDNGSNNHSAATNGTISSSTESSSDSVEPPKQPFIDSNNKDFQANNVCNEQFNAVVEKRTDSNQTDSDVRWSNLSAGNVNSVSDTVLGGSRGSNLNAVSASPVFSRAQINIHDNNSIDKALNGDSGCNPSENQVRCKSSNGIVNNEIDCGNQMYEQLHKSTTTPADIERYDNVETNGQRINNSEPDTVASINSNSIECETNKLRDNQLSKSTEDKESNQIKSTSTLLVQNSSEDCVSLTDTLSSNSIDVKPIKCPTDQSQTASESEEIGCKDNEIKEISHANEEPTQSSSGSNKMYEDHSLRTPLLGKNNNGINSTVYNAIDRPNQQPSNKGNNDDKCDERHVAYNEYVNLLCDTERNGVLNKNNKRNVSDEIRPLLRQSMSCDDGPNPKMQRKSNPRPRSIVKSPSTQNFGSNSSEKFDRKPRLSIQCSGTDPERPVLHVQFLSQHHNDSNDSVKGNLFNITHSQPSGEYESYQNGGAQCDLADKQPEQLINQMPPRGILRTSRVRSSISSSSSSESSSDSSSSDDVSQFAEAKPPDGGNNMIFI